jgi:hypothetical protein
LLLQVQKSKAGTGRVVGFRELGLVNAYTIEASFCGASVGKYAKQHFNTGGWRCCTLPDGNRHYAVLHRYSMLLLA